MSDPSIPVNQDSLPERSQVHELMDELDDLVCMLSMRDELVLQAGPPGSGWFFQPATRIVNADRGDLETRDPDFCRGLITHEAAHAAVTRYFDMIPRRLFEGPHLPTLLNVIEDCRIEEWLQRRLPGCKPMVELYNNILFAPLLEPDKLPASACGQFCMSILGRWWYGDFLEGVDPVVEDALEETWPEISKAIGLQPPAVFVDAAPVRSLYLRHPVSRVYLTKDFGTTPTGIEMLVRMYQYNMWGQVYQQVLPVFQRLQEHDRKQMGEKATQDLAQLLSQIRPVPDPQSLPQTGSARQGMGTPAWSQAAGPGPGGAAGLSAAVASALAADPHDKYLQTWQSLSSLIDQLAQDLIRLFEATLRSKWLRFQSSGTRLDVRTVMQFEADKRLYDRIWRRRTVPKRIDPAFILLIDVSGSMGGDPIEHAFEGVVLMTEVCARLGIPVDIWTFGNKAQHLHSWETPISAQTRATLGRVVQQCGGGTDMAGGIEAVTEALGELPHKDKVCFVLGDGEPNDEHATRKAVRVLENQDCTVLGLGIGDSTENLGRFFNDGLYNVPVERIATSLARMLRKYFLN